MIKIIFSTFISTIAIMSFAFSLFLNSVLAVFDLVAVSAGTLAKLQASQLAMRTLYKKQHLESVNLRKKLDISQKKGAFLNKNLVTAQTMAKNSEVFLKKQQTKFNLLQKNLTAKELNLSKLFVKRTSRKITASALSAITVGTVAVITTVGILEADDYCEEKKVLLQEENILNDTNKPFDIKTCLAMAKHDVGVISNAVKESLTGKFGQNWHNIKNASAEKWGNIRETANQNIGQAIDIAKKNRDEINRLSSESWGKLKAIYNSQ